MKKNLLITLMLLLLVSTSALAGSELQRQWVIENCDWVDIFAPMGVVLNPTVTVLSDGRGFVSLPNLSQAVQMKCQKAVPSVPPVEITVTPTLTPFQPLPTNTSTPTFTATVLPTNTLVPPTATFTNTPTNTPVPPTSTPFPPTNTPVPPTNTSVPTATFTPLPPTATNTPVPPTATPTYTPTPTATQFCIIGPYPVPGPCPTATPTIVVPYP